MPQKITIILTHEDTHTTYEFLNVENAKLVIEQFREKAGAADVAEVSLNFKAIQDDYTNRLYRTS